MKRMTRMRTQTEDTTAETTVEVCMLGSDGEESSPWEVLHSMWFCSSSEQVVVLVRWHWLVFHLSLSLSAPSLQCPVASHHIHPKSEARASDTHSPQLLLEIQVGLAEKVATVLVLIIVLSILILLYKCSSEPCNKKASKKYQINWRQIWASRLPHQKFQQQVRDRRELLWTESAELQYTQTQCLRLVWA